MKVLIQRVNFAKVHVNNSLVGATDKGLLLLVGIEKHDDQATLSKMAEKVCRYRLFADSDGKMNLNVNDIQGGILAVSQFTLAADTNKGLRPSFSAAAAPTLAEPLFNTFVEQLKRHCPRVETGEFGADMQVSLVNDGPVTFLLQN